MRDEDNSKQQQALMELVAGIKDSTLRVVLADLADANSKLGQLSAAAQQQQKEFKATIAGLERDIKSLLEQNKEKTEIIERERKENFELRREYGAKVELSSDWSSDWPVDANGSPVDED